MGLSLSLFISGELPAVALSITFENQGGFEMGTPAVAALNEAASLWQSVLSDNVSIKVGVQFAETSPATAYGSAFSDTYNYATVREALAKDQTSQFDIRAVAGLEKGQNFNFIVDPVPNTGATDPQQQGYRLFQGGSNPIETTLYVGSPAAKALGLTPLNAPALDGQMVFSNTAPFDYNRSNGIATDRLDFVGIAAHELGHVLGFVSGVDAIDAYVGCHPPSCSGPTLTDIKRDAQFTPLDLYRYSPLSRDLSRQLGVPVRDLSVTAVRFGENTSQSRFFSLTNGATSLAQFATGAFNGDGSQASHWKFGTQALMSSGMAGSPLGRVFNISLLDLFAFDVIGWDVRPLIPVGAPEPSTLWLIGSGLLGLGRWRRGQARRLGETRHH